MKNLLQLLLICVIILTSCYSQKAVQSLRSKQVLIENKMSKKEVLEIMGIPGDRQLKGELEVWQYCSSSASTFEFVVVWFSEALVGAVSTYKTYNCPTWNCEKCFNSIDFSAPPDAILELRTKKIN